MEGEWVEERERDRDKRGGQIRGRTDGGSDRVRERRRSGGREGKIVKARGRIEGKRGGITLGMFSIYNSDLTRESF